MVTLFGMKFPSVTAAGDLRESETIHNTGINA